MCKNKFWIFILVSFILALSGGCQSDKQYFQICYSPTWSSDGGRIAFLYKTLVSNIQYKYYYYTAYTANLNNGVNKINEFTSKDYRRLMWSPNNEYLLLTTKDEIFKVDKEGRNPTKIGDGEFPSFSYDSKKIVFTTNDRESVRLVGMNDEGKFDLKTQFTGKAFYPCWTNDGEKIQWLTVNVPDNKNQVMRYFVLSLYDLLTGKYQETPMISGLDESIEDGATWSRQKDKIIFSYNMNIYVLSLDGTKPVKICNGRDPEISPDNTKIVYSFPLDDKTADIYIYNLISKENTKIIDHTFLPKE